MRKGNPDFMNGVPELLILKLLATRELYGYELVQLIRERTNDAIQLGEGVVYPSLHSLEAEGSLKSKRKTVNGRSRIYYSVTKDGLSKLAQIAGVWSGVTRAVQDVLGGENHAFAL
jgi:PadR family transcriptional regulator PadR